VAAGSERTLHSVLVELAQRSHETHVLVDGRDYPSEYDGVAISSSAQPSNVTALYRWADVVVTQLASRHRAMRLSVRHRRPLVHFLQMGGLDRDATFGRPALVVFNASWLRDQDVTGVPALVLHPRVTCAEYVTTPGSANTLVGLSERKGARTFYTLARRLPDREFLGVRGGWGEQIVPETLPANVRIARNTPDMRAVYAQTRVLLVPSSHESFGRVCLEAGCSGIPVIAHPSPGVREALGPVGLYADRDDPDQWVAHLERLDAPAYYAQQSELIRTQTRDWDYDGEMGRLETRLFELVSSSGDGAGAR
jgi:hypothetical protein